MLYTVNLHLYDVAMASDRTTFFFLKSLYKNNGNIAISDNAVDTASLLGLRLKRECLNDAPAMSITGSELHMES